MAAGVCDVTRSANEVLGLATKAARGAGAPPAQAAQFGAAAVVHLIIGRDVGLLNDALDALPIGPVMMLPLAIASIAETQKEGIAAGDLTIHMSDLAHSYVAAMPCQGSLTSDGMLHLDLNRPAPRPVVERIDLPQETYDRWTALAAALLVPESDASRYSGAGAGLSDND